MTRKRRRKIENTIYSGYEASLKNVVAPYFQKKIKLKGLTAKDIQVWLGHSDFLTTANIYSHLDATSKGFSFSALEKSKYMGVAQQLAIDKKI